MMARRRLSPTATPSASVPNVPHAERSDLREATSLKPALAAAPIARVAGDAAGNAALEEVTREFARARETGRLVLELELDTIAPDHLMRDRIPVEDDEMAALRLSLRTHGQRTPIEVTPLQTEGALPYGLISGWRRLAALKALFAETGETRFSKVQALIRRPETVADAYVAMVEENEIRVGLSQYERARVAALAVRRGVFKSEKEALLALFASASRPKRSRIRAFLEIYHALDDVLRFPVHLTERLGLKLVEMLRDGRANEIIEALRQADPQTPDDELECLENLFQYRPDKSSRSVKDKTIEELLPGVLLEQSLVGQTLTLKLTGKPVGPELALEIREALMRLHVDEISI